MNLAYDLAADLERSALSSDDAVQAAGNALPAENNALELMSLPHEILERILDFLLNANDARDPVEIPLELAVPNYHFCTTVVRVNKTISSIGTRIFKRNHFMLVSTSDPDLLKALIEDNVWLRNQRLSYFNSYSLCLHLTSLKSERNHNDFFMMCRDNATDLVRHLCMIDLLEPREWKFKFNILGDDKVSGHPEEQRVFLEPFLKTRTRWQKCSIKGAIDANLARELETTMMPRKHWLRENAWNLLDLVHYKKSIGDSLLYSKKIAAAHGAYNNFFRYWERIHEYATDLCGDDKNLANSFGKLYLLGQMNSWIVNLRVAFRSMGLPAAREQRYKFVILSAKRALSGKSVTERELTFCHFVCAISHFALHNFKESVSSLEAYMQVTRKYPSIVIKFAESATELDLVEDKESADFQKRHDMLLRKMLNSLSMKPLRSAIPLKKSVSRFVEFERYVLARIGYTGDMLEDQVVQEQGYTLNPFEQRVFEGSLDTELADRYVATLKENISADVRDFNFGMQTPRGPTPGRLTFANELSETHIGGQYLQL